MLTLAGAEGLAVSCWLGSLLVDFSIGGPAARIHRHSHAYLTALQEVCSALVYAS